MGISVGVMVLGKHAMKDGNLMRVNGGCWSMESAISLVSAFEHVFSGPLNMCFRSFDEPCIGKKYVFDNHNPPNVCFIIAHF